MNRTYHILIVEDNPGDYLLVEELLSTQRLGYSLTRATTFSSAQSMLSARKNAFDVILLDLSLPDQTGMPLVRAMLNVCGHVPVIILTGYADIKFSVRSLSVGVADYLLKDELIGSALYKSIIYSIERQQAKSALEASEKKYSELFRISPLPMWVVDVDTMQFLDMNIAMVNDYGYSRAELLAMTLRDIRPPEEVAKLAQAMAEDLRPEQPLTCRIMLHQTKNGEVRQVELQVAPILFKGRNANLVIAKDITDTQNYISAIEAQNQQLLEISWIQSHVVRAPLSRMMGLIPLIAEAKDKDADMQEMLGYLALSAGELDEVIRAISQKTAQTRLPKAS